MNHTILTTKSTAPGTKLVCDYTFACGNTVPVYDVTSMHGLNQLLGHAKFVNKEYGDVYYRGQGALYDTLIPSLFRKWDGLVAGTLARGNTLDDIILRMMQSDKIAGDLKLSGDKKYDRLRIEGILQHYGIPTKCIDLVDNHWVALWMGLYECQKIEKVETFYHYQKREIPFIELIKKEKEVEDVIYQYILLLALPNGKNTTNGLTISDDYVTIDLRKAVSSVFLRPHAQHAIVAERRPHQPKDINDYDMAPAVVGIIRLRIDMVDKWMGNGQLLTQENLFPPPSMDKGYGQLLTCQNLLASGYELAKYV